MLKCYEITPWDGGGSTAEGAIPDGVPYLSHLPERAGESICREHGEENEGLQEGADESAGAFQVALPLRAVQQAEFVEKNADARGAGGFGAFEFFGPREIV
jgi:hypothetical protein